MNTRRWCLKTWYSPILKRRCQTRTNIWKAEQLLKIVKIHHTKHQNHVLLVFFNIRAVVTHLSQSPNFNALNAGVFNSVLLHWLRRSPNKNLFFSQCCCWNLFWKHVLKCVYCLLNSSVKWAMQFKWDIFNNNNSMRPTLSQSDCLAYLWHQTSSLLHQCDSWFYQMSDQSEAS